VYKLWSSSLCSFLQPPPISSLFSPNIPPSTFLKHAQLLFFPWCERPFHTHTDQVKLWFCLLCILERRQILNWMVARVPWI
jgi:hypothetical protein